MSEPLAIWTLCKHSRLVLSLVVLVLTQTCRHVGAPPVSDWDPKFIAYLKGNKIYVSFHQPFKDAPFYMVMITNKWMVCWDREITNEQVGKEIIFDIEVKKCRQPYRANVYAASENKTALTGLMQTVIRRAGASTTSPTATTATTTAGPKEVDLHLLYIVLIAVAFVIIIAVIVVTCRRWSLSKSSTSEQNPGRGVAGSGDDPEPRRVHPLYEHWDPQTSPLVESIMALLRAHGQIDVWPYSQHADAIRPNCNEWVEKQMKRTVLVCRRGGSAAETQWDRSKDHYNVVGHTLDRLRDHEHDVILVDLTVAVDVSLNNERRREDAVVKGRSVTYGVHLARATSDGHVELSDLEELVRRLHEGRYPCRRMRNWRRCAVAVDLLNKARALREQDGALPQGSEAEVRCCCWDGNGGEEGRALLQGEENTTRMELSDLV